MSLKTLLIKVNLTLYQGQAFTLCY